MTLSSRAAALWFGSLIIVAAVAVGATWTVADTKDSSGKALGDPTAATDADSGTVTTTTGSSDERPTWLFSEVAGGGTFTTGADGTHTLTLTDLDPKVTAFTDRPARDSQVMPVELFFNSWEQMFQDSPPNAVLVEHDPAGDADSYVVELTDPKWDGATASFTATPVDGTADAAALPGSTDSAGQLPPATFDAVSLFIDDVETGDTVACMNQWYAPNYVLTPPGSMPNTHSGDWRIAANFSRACTSAGGTVVMF